MSKEELYRKRVLNIGFVGDGKYNYCNNKYIYKAWSHMITRCYDEKYSNQFPTYKDCTVCKKWHNFQNFAEWYEENLWGNKNPFLDKDILVKGNKIYNPNTCILVDNRINCLFTKCNSARGKYPIGVSIDKRTNSIRAYIFKNEKRTIKYCKSVEEAFQLYKESKESYIKQVADQYSKKHPNFPTKFYNAMYNYQVEITD